MVPDGVLIFFYEVAIIVFIVSQRWNVIVWSLNHICPQ